MIRPGYCSPNLECHQIRGFFTRTIVGDVVLSAPPISEACTPCLCWLPGRFVCCLHMLLGELLSALTFLVGVLIGGASVQWIGLRKKI